MKHEELQTALAEYLTEMSIFVSQEQMNLLVRHIELVLDANQRVNLTRVLNPLSALRLHTADSLSVLEDLDKAPDGTLLDLGSGAGFPGIPLAICAKRPVVLLDSVAKKIRELALIVAELGLEGRVRAVAARAEGIGAHTARGVRCRYCSGGIGASSAR